MFKTFILILAAVNIVDAIIRYIKNDTEALFLDTTEISFDLFVVALVDTLYYHTYYKLFSLTSIWFNIIIIAITAPCFIFSFMRSQGYILNIVARDKDGNIILDENGKPLIGKAAREAVKNAKSVSPAMTIKINGEVNKDASDAATKYMRKHWVEDGKFKTKDDNGDSISEEDILKDVQRYVFKEWAPANGYADEEESEKDLLEELLNKTVLDCVKNLNAEQLAEFMQDAIRHGCDGCEDFEKCQTLSEEEKEQKEVQCTTKMLNNKVFVAASPEDILKEMEESSEEDS